MADKNYFEHRMKLLGVGAENNKVRLFNPEAEFPMPKWTETEIFSEDQQGNIEILYYTIEGQFIIYYNNNKTPKPQFYTLKRLKEPKGDMKYQLPKGQGTFPWFHPALLEKYQKGEKIDCLYFTEGAFKAWKGCEAGLDVVGLTSITHYADRSGQLHRDVRLLIEKCQVETVAILWDGDCLQISRKDIQARTEATRRPFGFFNAAKKIRELVRQMPFEKTREAPRVYFMHVKPDSFEEKPKGLDDILITAEQQEKQDAVVKDAKRLDEKGPFFYKHNITNSPSRLFQYFGLGKAEVFYHRHSEWIGETEFFFRGDLMYYNDDKNELEIIAPGWAKQIRWIGDEFFVERLVPGANRDRRVLLKRNKDTLNDLYGKGFQKYLKFFDGFCNVPSHFNYEQIIEREGKQYYNRYFPFLHQPKEGEYSAIIGFIKHIFGDYEIKHPSKEESYQSFELGLDYVQLLLTEPNQILPVLCLYSPENVTGKSTLGKFLGYLFEDNCIQIGNSDLQSEFNEQYADKLLAICEETLLERKKDVERIKAMSTSSQISVNPKGQKQYSIDFFCKFQFYSNNKRMIYLNKYDERFWIIRVHKIKIPNTNLLQQMKQQIPAFIHFLKHRKLATQRESRMHFNPELIKTEAFYETVKVNEPTAATDLREAVTELFLQEEGLDEIRMPLKNIREEFFSSKTSTSWIKEILKDYLDVDLLRNKDGKARHMRGHYIKYEYDHDEEEFVRKELPWRGRPYQFKRADFVKEEVVMEVVSKPIIKTKGTGPF